MDRLDRGGHLKRVVQPFWEPHEMSTSSKSESPAQATPLVSALLSFPAVCELLGREPNRAARLWLWRSARSGVFCAPLKLGGTIRWRKTEVENFLVNLKPVSYAHQENA